MDQTASFIFATDYRFLPEGVKKVQEIFDQQLKKKNLFADHHYQHDRDTFVVTCSITNLEEVQITFHRIVRKLIEIEVGDDYDEDDEIESKLIGRIPYNKDGTVQATGSGASNCLEYPLEIRFCRFKFTWTCQTPDHVMEKIIPEAAQTQIESLTGTKLSQDLNSQVIFVGAHSEEFRDRAIHKLDILRKYYDLQRQKASHIFYSETIDNFHICIKPLSSIKKKLVETTFLDPWRHKRSLIKYDNLHRIYTTRCCPYESLRTIYTLRKGEKLFPVVQEEDKSVPFQLWVDYTFPAKGHESLNVMREHPPGQEVEEELRSLTLDHVDKRESIEQWFAKGIPKDPVETYRQMLDDLLHGDRARVSSFSGPTTKDLKYPPSFLPTTLVRSTPAAKSVGEDEDLLNFSPIKDLSVPGSSVRGSRNGKISDLEEFLNPHPDQTLLDYDYDNFRFDVLVPSSNDHASQPASSHLVATGPPIIQRHSEVDTRVYHNVMRQGALNKGKGRDPEFHPPLVPASDPTMDFVKQMNGNIKHILAGLRAWQGEIAIEAQFGRILIREVPRPLVAFGDSSLSHPPEEVTSLLCESPHTASFTKLLTTLPAEIQWFIDIKDFKGQQAWQPAPKWTVTYEYECFDLKSSTPLIIEIDAETFTAKVKALPKDFGSVYVHCTLRNWDYRVTATGYKSIDEEYYGSIAKEIADSTYIASDLKRMEMCFQLSKVHSIQFNTIRVRRHSQYQSNDGKSLLNITEVHDLEVNSMEAVTKTMFHAISPESIEYKGDQPMWYEIGIASAIAEEAFMANTELELGEEVDSWTEEGILTALPDIYKPANYLIKQMDGMGFYNDNGVQLSEAKPVQNAFSYQGQPTTHSRMGYW